MCSPLLPSWFILLIAWLEFAASMAHTEEFHSRYDPLNWLIQGCAPPHFLPQYFIHIGVELRQLLTCSVWISEKASGAFESASPVSLSLKILVERMSPLENLILISIVAENSTPSIPILHVAFNFTSEYELLEDLYSGRALPYKVCSASLFVHDLYEITEVFELEKCWCSRSTSFFIHLRIFKILTHLYNTPSSSYQEWIIIEHPSYIYSC